MNRQNILMVASFLAVLGWSAYKPHDYLTWFLEVLPAVLALGLLIFFYKRFRFTPLVYWLIWVHAIVLVIGGHYTYAETPIGEWMKMIFNSTRNNYDKIGHFMQGFVPALVAKEILVRKKIVTGYGWMFFIVVSICLAASAMYELFEWGASELLGDDANDFLGTQGYKWDTQTDMALAFGGAILSLLLFRRMHDRQIKSISKP
jgi:putative membrane protein